MCGTTSSHTRSLAIIAGAVAVLAAPAPAMALTFAPAPGSPVDMSADVPEWGRGAPVVGDVNGDARADVVVPGEDGRLYVLRGDGTGRLRPPRESVVRGLGVAGATAGGDVNGDGRMDLLVAEQDDRVHVLLGGADGRLRPAPGSPLRLPVYRPFLGDVTGDGRPDLVADRWDGWLEVRTGRGDGRFTTPGLTSRPGDAMIAVADVTGDGRADALLTEGCPSRLWTLSGAATGQLSGAPPLPCQDAERPRDYGEPVLLTGDVDADGRLDAILTDAGWNRAAVRGGDGTGGFGPMSIPVAPGGDAAATADFDRDGRADVAVVRPTWGDIVILLGGLGPTLTRAPGASFDHGLHLGEEESPDGVASADLNRDGRPDLLTLGPWGQLAVLLNRGTPAPPPPPRGTARLVAPRGCLRARTTSVTVYGRQITQVVFDHDLGANGTPVTQVTPVPPPTPVTPVIPVAPTPVTPVRPVASAATSYVRELDAPNAPDGGFRLRVRTRGISRGRHHVGVQVTFSAPSHTRSRTLHATLRRC